MRHDSHYVEELTAHQPATLGRMIDLEKLDPNPEQPRVDFGDLTELTASIAEKGVLEPLLVKPSRATGRWMIIAGERRYRKRFSNRTPALTNFSRHFFMCVAKPVTQRQ